MAALRADGVLPELLGLTRVMSEDAVPPSAPSTASITV
jgi:hypothetical protein